MWEDHKIYPRKVRRNNRISGFEKKKEKPSSEKEMRIGEKIPGQIN